MRGFSVVRAAVVLTAMLVAAPAAMAQSRPDARWQPWLGCWVASLPRTVGANETMVCVVPEESGSGVELTVIADNKVAHRELISAAGMRTPKVFDTCPGWETASFSTDERRIFLRSEFACGKTAIEGSGVFAISDAGEWIEVRGSIIGGRSTVRAVRYRPAGRTLRRLAAGTASDSMPFAVVDEREAARHQRFAAGAPVSADAVLEAAKAVQTPVAEAWLNELRQIFALNGTELVRLSDAGMPPSMIDLMVALSYPKRFAVRRAEYEPTSGGGAMTIETPRTLTDDAWSRRRENCGYASYSGYYGDACYPGYFGYGVYGYDPYFYSAYGRMYGYTYGGYYSGYYGGYYWGSRPIVIVNTGTTGDNTPAPRGQAVKGQGYTRQNSGGSPSTNTSGSSGSAGSSGSNAGSSSAGSSSSGSSGSGRTAKPRPPV
jgi:hypothetical protein